MYWGFAALLQTLKHYTSVKTPLVIAIPCLGTGVGQMEPKDSANQIQRAFDDFTTNNIKYNAMILYNSPRGFVIDRFEAVQNSNYANTEIKNIQTQKRILKLLTWNVWFKQFHFQERMDHIIEEFKRCDPDVICLQEGTKYTITHFKGDDFINFKYDMMYDPKVESGYGDIILVKKAIKECFMTNEAYPSSNMNRRMTRAYLPYFETEVCTTHLESIFKHNNASYLEDNIKHNQFKHLLGELGQSKAKNVIIAGDFNIGDEDEETIKNLLEASPFKDIFLTLPEDRKGNVKNTYDSSINKNILGNFHSRLDRVFIYSKDQDTQKSSKLTPFSYKVVGMTPFIPREPDRQGYVYPSDHFGVLCTFTL